MKADYIARGLHARWCGTHWMASCPAHKDRSPSLRICEKDGKVLVHCFAGCSQGEVIAALRALGLWPERPYEHVTTAEERRAWIRERRRVERYLPAAELWRRMALIFGEEILDQLKSTIWDSSLPQPWLCEITQWTDILKRWKGLDGFGLVEEYLSQKRSDPRLTKAMIRAARDLELAELRALLRYLNAEAEEAA